LAIVDRLKAAIKADELAQPLRPALKHAEDEAFTWALRKRPDDQDDDTDVDDGHVEKSRKASRGRRSVHSQEDLDGAISELRAFSAEQGNKRLIVEWRVDG
jgi:hypothetical protein